MPQLLGAFGHHPDTSTDYCIEVEALEGLAYEIGVGIATSQWPFWGRLSKALRFPVPADEYGPRARAVLDTMKAWEPWPEYVPARALNLMDHPDAG